MKTRNLEAEIDEIRDLMKELMILQKETDRRIKQAFDLYEGQRGKSLV